MPGLDTLGAEGQTFRHVTRTAFAVAPEQFRWQAEVACLAIVILVVLGVLIWRAAALGVSLLQFVQMVVGTFFSRIKRFMQRRERKQASFSAPPANMSPSESLQEIVLTESVEGPKQTYASAVKSNTAHQTAASAYGISKQANDVVINSERQGTSAAQFFTGGRSYGGGSTYRVDTAR